MSRKICPLNPSKRGQDTTPCQREDCALWNDLSEECCIATVAKGMVFMLGQVAETEVNNDNNTEDERGLSRNES